MRLGPVLAIAAATGTTLATAEEVRRSEFPASLHGTWATSRDDCGASEGKLVISAKQYTRGNSTCDVAWVTVIPASKAPIYSARVRCTDQSGTHLPPSVLVIHPSDGSLMVGAADADLKPYQRCP